MELHWKFANKSILFWFTFHHGNGSGCLGLQPNTVVQNYWMKNKLISIIKSNWLNQWMTFSIILYLSASCRMLQGHKKTYHKHKLPGYSGPINQRPPNQRRPAPTTGDVDPLIPQPLQVLCSTVEPWAARISRKFRSTMATDGPRLGPQSPNRYPWRIHGMNGISNYMNGWCL